MLKPKTQGLLDRFQGHKTHFKDSAQKKKDGVAAEAARKLLTLRRTANVIFENMDKHCMRNVFHTFTIIVVQAALSRVASKQAARAAYAIQANETPGVPPEHSARVALSKRLLVRGLRDSLQSVRKTELRP